MRFDDDLPIPPSSEKMTSTVESNHPPRNLSGKTHGEDGYEYLEYPPGGGAQYYRSHPYEPWKQCGP